MADGGREGLCSFSSRVKDEVLHTKYERIMQIKEKSSPIQSRKGPLSAAHFGLGTVVGDKRAANERHSLPTNFTFWAFRAGCRLAHSACALEQATTTDPSLPKENSGPMDFAQAAQLPVDEQLAQVRAALERNRSLMTVLERARDMGIPNWYVAGGSISQTIWNAVTNRPGDTGIADYDLVYFDGADLSYEAEDVVIQQGRRVFADVATQVEIKNQARVHLWYEARFGVRCPKHASTEAAIDLWASNTAMVGVRLLDDGRWKVYAPRGFSDFFNLVVRPHAAVATKAAFEKKVARWLTHWPELRVVPWPGEPAPERMER
jgi:hypothetical protein